MTQTSEQQPERKKQTLEMECTICGHRWKSRGYGIRISCPACYEAKTGKKPGLSPERFRAEVLPYRPAQPNLKKQPEPPDPRQLTIEDLTAPPPKPLSEAQKKPSDKKPSDKKPSDKKPSDKKPSDKKPSDKKPSDKKQAEPPKPSGGFLDRLLNSRIGGGS